MTPARLRAAHVACDAALVSLAWLAAWATRALLSPLIGVPLNDVGSYLVALPGIVAAWLLSCWTFGIYATTRMETAVDQLQRLLRGVLLGLTVVSAIAFFGRELSIGRAVVLLTAAYALGLQGASRLAFHRLEKNLRTQGRFDVPALIIGAGVAGCRLLQKLQDHPETGFRVVGFLDDDPELQDTKVGGHPVLGDLRALRNTIERLGVREVFVATPGMSHTEMLSRVLECEDLDVDFRVVTDLFEVLTASTRVDLVDDLPLVRLGGRRPGPLYEPTKRAFDLLVASAGLLLLAPAFAYWAWKIRRDSPGPAFFVQERIGRHGRPFRMWKLRTMVSDTARYARAPSMHGDPRTTPYGAWLRRTSIDELPQLWNVVRGEMSLVGPRPEMPFIVDTYSDWQRCRLATKPGLAGLWQILGRKDLPMQENLQYDFYYIRNRSFALDLSLLLRTLGAVFRGRGAY